MKKILLIEDDELVAKSLARLLRVKGYEVEEARNAVDAVSLAAVKDFDLVVSDIRMPGENGIVAIEKIKHIYRERNISSAFIIITGYAEEDTPAHAIRLGINKFLFKPLDTETFLQSIEEELDLLQKERSLKARPVSSAIVIKRKFPEDRLQLKRAVITGIGCISPNGIGKDAYWEGLKEGKNCVNQITFFDISEFPSKMAAEILDFDPADFIEDRNELKRMGRSSHLAVAGAKLAVRDAGLSFDGQDSDAISVILGSAVSGLEYVETDFRSLAFGGVRKVRPFLGIAGFGGAISSEISRALGVRGQSLTISTGCTSSTDAMGYSLNLIRSGQRSVVVTGGADACVTPGILAAFCQMGAVSTWKDNFSKASRPFNKDRAGFVISEGSWIFIFEELNHALGRKTKIYGEVVGYGATCDAWHMAKPHPSGEYTARAIELALSDAGVAPNEIDLFEAYGNGTPVNDSYETGVVKRVFGAHAYNLAMPSIKSMLGHPLGASGAQQVAAALMAFQEGVIHPTINYEVPDPECDLDYVPNRSVERKVRAAVCNTLAFGAKNAALVIRSF